MTALLKAQKIPSDGKLVVVTSSICNIILGAMFGRNVEVLPRKKSERLDVMRTMYAKAKTMSRGAAMPDLSEPERASERARLAGQVKKIVHE